MGVKMQKVKEIFEKPIIVEDERVYTTQRKLKCWTCPGGTCSPPSD